MASRSATSPDGRVWAVSVYRVRLPRWPESDWDPDVESWDPLGFVAYVVLAPIFWLLIPLARVLLALPVAVGRSFFSRTRWVEALCGEPSGIRIVWRTSRERADEVADHVARQLGKGYADLVPAGVVRESMTAPPGFADLDA